MHVTCTHACGHVRMYVQISQMTYLYVDEAVLFGTVVTSFLLLRPTKSDRSLVHAACHWRNSVSRQRRTIGGFSPEMPCVVTDTL